MVFDECSAHLAGGVVLQRCAQAEIRLRVSGLLSFASKILSIPARSDLEEHYWYNKEKNK